MEPTRIDSSELLPLDEYERRRASMRSKIIELKTLRRVEVGPWVSLVFENRDTVRFQVQEMLRVERISEPEKVAHEIETYSELLPGAGELSATLFIEITDDAQRRAALQNLGGIENRTSIRIGNLKILAEDKRPIDPRFERPGWATCVYYLRFSLDERSRRAFMAGEEPVWLEIGHKRYGHATRLPERTRRSLAEDLR